MTATNLNRIRMARTLALVGLLSVGLIANTVPAALAQSSGTFATTGMTLQDGVC